MKRASYLPRFVTFLLFLTACSGGTASPPLEVDNPEEVPQAVVETPSPLPDVDGVPSFSLYSTQPVLERGSGWDKKYVYTSAVTVQGGLFHMFYGGSSEETNADQLGSVGYAVSVDGIEWHRFSEEPLQFVGDLVADMVFINVTSVIRDGDGRWVMYFSAGWSDSGPTGQSWIGRAVAENPEGPWMVDEAPVLLPGGDTRWDGGGLYDPKVFKTEHGYRMYYTGLSPDTSRFGPTQIGMALSEDGITWTKHDVPSTNEPLFENSDPVFRVGEAEAWDGALVGNAQIIPAQRGWVMLYRGTGMNDPGESPRWGYATSRDGIVWERNVDNPIISLDDFLVEQTIWQVVWVYFGGRNFLYLSGYEPSTGLGNVFLALAE